MEEIEEDEEEENEISACFLDILLSDEKTISQSTLLPIEIMKDEEEEKEVFEGGGGGRREVEEDEEGRRGKEEKKDEEKEYVLRIEQGLTLSSRTSRIHISLSLSSLLEVSGKCQENYATDLSDISIDRSSSFHFKGYFMIERTLYGDD